MYKFNFYHTRPENFFRNNKAEQTKGLVGYLRGDFGRDGNEFHHTWFNNNEKLNKGNTYWYAFESAEEARRYAYVHGLCFMGG